VPLALIAPFFSAWSFSATSLAGLDALRSDGIVAALALVAATLAWAHEPGQHPLQWLTRTAVGLALAAVPLAGSMRVLDTYDLPKQSFSTLLMATALVAWAAGRVADPREPRPLPRPVSVCAVAFIFAGVLSVTRAVNPMLAAWEVGRIILMVVTIVVVHDLADTPARAARLLGLAGSTAVVVTGISCIQSLGHQVPGFPQVVPPAATFGNKNMATEYLVMLYPIMLVLTVWGGRAGGGGAGIDPAGELSSWAGAALAAVMTYVLVVSHTRADWMAMTAVLGAVAAAWVVHARHGRADLRDDAASAFDELHARRGWRAVVAVLVGFFLVWGVARAKKLFQWGEAAPIEETARAAFDTTRGSTQWRLVAWANTVIMVVKNPLTGVGANNWQLQYPNYHRAWRTDPSFDTRTQATTLHNDYLQYWAELGLPGAVGFLGLFFVLGVAFHSCLYDRRERWGPPGVAAASGCIAGAVDAFFSFPFKLACPTLIFWTLFAVAVRAASELELGPWRSGPKDDEDAAVPIGPRTSGLDALRPALLLMCASLGGITMAGWAIADLKSSAHLRRAYELSGRQRWEEARDEFHRGAEENPYVYNPWLLLGRAYYQTNQLLLAVAANSIATWFHPYHCNIYYNMGNCWREMGRLDRALEAFDRTVRIYPGNADGWNNRGNVLKVMGRAAEAMASFDSALQARPDSYEALLNRGHMFLAQGKLKEGIESIAAVLKLDPKFYRAHQAIGNALTSAGDVDGAIKAYEAALAIDPGYVEALNNLGGCRWRKGDAERAISAFERAIALKPTFGAPYFGLADVYYKQGMELRKRGDLEAARQRLDTARRALQVFLAHWPAADWYRKTAEERLRELATISLDVTTRAAPKAPSPAPEAGPKRPPSAVGRLPVAANASPAAPR
jgi:tetratricopeptide (TPR) repeat protein